MQLIKRYKCKNKYHYNYRINKITNKKIIIK